MRDRQYCLTDFDVIYNNFNYNNLKNYNLDYVILNLNYSNEKLFIFNRNGIFFLANNSWMDLCKYDLEELINQNLRILQGEKTDKKIIKNFMNDLLRYKESKMDVINYDKNGKELYINYCANYIKDSNDLYLCKVEEI